MSFHQRLEEIRLAFENGETPEETVHVLNTHIESLLSGDAVEQAIGVGDMAPIDLTCESEGRPVSLRQFLEQRFLVLTWFRGNW